MFRSLTGNKKLSNFCIAIAFCCFAVSLAGAAKPLFVTKLPDYDDAVYAPVYIDGKPHLCVIDSGFDYSLLHSTLRESLGEPIGRHVDNAIDGSPFEVETFVFPAATMGTVELTGEARIGCSDLTAIREATGRNVEGILGIDFFKAHIVQLDFDKRELRILDGTTSSPESWGSPVQLSPSPDGLREKVVVSLDNKFNEQFVVDTAFSGSLCLTSSLYRNLRKTHSVVSTGDVHMATAAGLGVNTTGVIASARINSFENQNLPIDVMAENLIGLSYLATLQCHFRPWSRSHVFGETKRHLCPGR